MQKTQAKIICLGTFKLFFPGTYFLNIEPEGQTSGFSLIAPAEHSQSVFREIVCESVTMNTGEHDDYI